MSCEKMELGSLRRQMKEKGVDTYIVTKFDPHNTEYTPDYWNGIKFISNFTGSSGMVAVTADKAGLWTDGRYYLQAEKELAGTGIALYRSADPETKPFLDWITEETPENGCIGVNGLTVNAQGALELKKKINFKGITLKGHLDLLAEIWKDRPPLSSKPVYEHALNFCGESRAEKIKRVRQEMKKEGADIYILSVLDDIAWLMNLRGNDFENSTLFSSYAAIEENNVILFIDPTKALGESNTLKKDGIELRGYEDIFEYARGIDSNKKVMLSPDNTSFYLYNTLENCILIDIPADITTVLKAQKNETELSNWENANIRDGVAMVRFIKWLKEEVNTREIPETEITDKLSELRELGENYLMPSFATIAAYMENAAFMHYKATEDSYSKIKPEGFLLVDSGGNYLDGTTDITRTIVLGNISDEMKKDFTLVLKAHISMAKAVFLHGATGSNLDILARQPLWEEGIDYKCGTGHGIGYCLNVHEGPQRISMVTNSYRLEPGMVVTNEPGIYRKGRYGIRTENLIQVTPRQETEDGRFLCFKTFSYCPIDLEGINKAYLNSQEIQWLNDYHKEVYNKLSPCLLEEERQWLAAQTRAI